MSAGCEMSKHAPSSRADQEANYSYLTGCPTSSSSLFVVFGFPSKSSTETSDIKHQLFIPRADPLETMWSVAPPTLEESRATFDSDSIEYTESLEKALRDAVGRANDTKGGRLVVHTLPNTLEFPPLPDSINAYFGQKIDRETSYLLDALHIARLTKDECEIDLIREANRISSGAHEVLMRELGSYAEKRKAKAEASGSRTRTGREGVSQWEVESEMDAEALFVATCKRSG